MRCQCCDVILTDQEATRKFTVSKYYTDACDTCLDFMLELETSEGSIYSDDRPEDYINLQVEYNYVDDQ